MPSRSRSALARASGSPGTSTSSYAGGGRDRLELREQPAQQLGGALAAGEPTGVEREVEVPDVLRSRVLVETADAVADPGARQRPREHLDEHRERVALVAAERDGGEDVVRIGRRLPLRVDAPALGDLAALVARVEDAVDGDLAGRHVGVEDAVGRRRGERDRVGAQGVADAAVGNDERLGVRRRHPDHAGLRGADRVVPGGAVVARAVHGHDAHPVAACEVDREVGREDARDLAGALVGVDERDGAVLALDLRHRAAVGVARPQALAVHGQARDAVRVDGAAVGVDERDGHRLGGGGLEPGGLEQRLRPALQLSGGDQ